jgi:hypothetical protein
VGARFFAHVQTGSGAHRGQESVELYLYPPSRPAQACNGNTLLYLYIKRVLLYYYYHHHHHHHHHHHYYYCYYYYYYYYCCCC